MTTIHGAQKAIMRPAKRAFRGLAGSPLAEEDDSVAPPPLPEPDVAAVVNEILTKAQKKYVSTERPIRKTGQSYTEVKLSSGDRDPAFTTNKPSGFEISSRPGSSAPIGLCMRTPRRNTLMGEEVKQLQERIAALEDRVGQLDGCYQDIAYEFTNNLAKRIEDIRKEVIDALNNVRKNAENLVTDALNSVEDRVYSEALGKISQAVEEARQNLRHDAIAADVKQQIAQDIKRHVEATLTDPSTGRRFRK